MSQDERECVVITKEGMMIETILFMRSTSYQPVLRLPTIEEVMKITDGCSASLKKIAESEKHTEASNSLLNIVFEQMVEKHGRENVTIIDDTSLTVIDNGVSHKVWVE